MRKLEPLAERSCGSCTLCCKLLGVKETRFDTDSKEWDELFDKLSNKWCVHCDVGKGCKIYEERPEPCESFQCSWLLGFLGPEFRPDKTRCVYYVGDIWNQQGTTRKVWCIAEDTPMITRNGVGRKLVDTLETLAIRVPGEDRPSPLPIVVICGANAKIKWVGSNVWEELSFDATMPPGRKEHETDEHSSVPVHSE